MLIEIIKKLTISAKFLARLVYDHLLRVNLAYLRQNILLRPLSEV